MRLHEEPFLGPSKAADLSTLHSLEIALFKQISKREHPHRDLSTSLRFGRDDKGEDSASTKEQLLDESRFSRCAARVRWVVGIEPGYCAFK